jgi:hypothetical protein
MRTILRYIAYCVVIPTLFGLGCAFSYPLAAGTPSKPKPARTWKLDRSDTYYEVHCRSIARIIDAYVVTDNTGWTNIDIWLNKYINKTDAAIIWSDDPRYNKAEAD